MGTKYLLMIIGFIIIAGTSEAANVWNIARGLIQNNGIGQPIVHQNTVWDFDPEQGKARRVRYEALNGRLGQDLISRLGQGMDFDGPWGVKVAKPRPDVRYNLKS